GKEGVSLLRHEAYHQGRPFIPEVRLAVAKPGNQVDVIELTAPEAAAVAADGDWKLVQRPDQGYQYLGLNQQVPAFADRRVRQALLYAIDRQGLINQALQGYATVVNTHMTVGSWAYDPAVLEPYAYNPARAVELLTEAGWKERDKDGYLMRNGKRLGFTLTFPEGNGARERTATWIQANLKALGVKVNLQPMPFGQVVKEVFGERRAEAWLLGWDVGPEPDPGPVFSPDNKWGLATGWTHDLSQQLLIEGRGRVVPSERKAVYTQWAKLVNEELPLLFLYAENQVEAYRADRLHGVSPDARGLRWNIWQWWIPKEKQGK
ncbi:MAG TPA: ABC transporter substrate-binding protein, partial [Symbiobacteriaceae bacterium]|nr:ABC transporter substrate-binding protein [Symbiobacteriaceae bacterium]